MNNWLLSAVGLFLIAIGMWETFVAVLYPRAVMGPIATLINRVFHGFIRTKLFSSSSLVLFSGPLLIVCHAICWATLLLIGFSLLVWPHLGSAIVASGSKPTDTSFSTAVYFAGYSITTLGMGDLIPQTGFTRCVTITAAAVGFSYFTLVLAYIVSVYSTLARRNQFACEIDYRTQRTGHSLQYLTPYLKSGDHSLLNQDLLTLAAGLADLLESHHFYPVLHYFRFKERRYAMSQMLRFCLEVATLLRSLQAADGTATQRVTEPSDRLWHASLQLLEDTRKHFVICESTEASMDTSSASELWTHSFSGNANTHVPSHDDFLKAYETMCETWSRDLHSLEVCTGSTISQA